MLKPAGPRCNLSCSYCYYAGKQDLFSGRQSGHAMSDALLEEFVSQYMDMQTSPEVLFTWHGGEPLLRPLSFYRKAVVLQHRYARGRQTDNCLQTNGLLLTDEWCRFFRDNNFLIGISIDGTEQMHDRFRGRGSWQRVMHGIELLERHGVQWNAMATVNAANVAKPEEFYDFFRRLLPTPGFLQFTPILSWQREVGATAGANSPSGPSVPDEGRRSPSEITAADWGRFLCAVYDAWVCRDIGQLFVQLFDATLANWVGHPPGICSLSAMCGHAAVMESDGSVYSCDHFVFPRYRLGNILESPLTGMMYGEQQRSFSQMKTGSLPRQCRECRWLSLCHGECPKNRILADSYGQPGLNYFCDGYRQFFSHVAADMAVMAAELEAGGSPADAMLNIHKQ